MVNSAAETGNAGNGSQISSALALLQDASPATLKTLRDDSDRFIETARTGHLQEGEAFKKIADAQEFPVLVKRVNAWLQGIETKNLMNAIRAFVQLCHEGLSAAGQSASQGIGGILGLREISEQVCPTDTLMNPPYFEKFSVESALIEALRPQYENLPPDKYLRLTEGTPCFRYRRYSAANVSEQGVEWLSAQTYFQSIEHNPYAGGIVRHFEPLENQTRDLVGPILLNCFSRLPREKYPRGVELAVYQFRIVASPGFPGKPAPEGPHQDGFDFFQIFCIQRYNIKGGVTTLYKENPKDLDGDSIHECTLLRGEGIRVDDRRLFHYTSEIEVADPGKPAFRDILGVTVEASKQNT